MANSPGCCREELSETGLDERGTHTVVMNYAITPYAGLFFFLLSPVEQRSTNARTEQESSQDGKLMNVMSPNAEARVALLKRRLYRIPVSS